jgi:hypothetical protein
VIDLLERDEGTENERDALGTSARFERVRGASVGVDTALIAIEMIWKRVANEVEVDLGE